MKLTHLLGILIDLEVAENSSVLHCGLISVSVTPSSKWRYHIRDGENYIMYRYHFIVLLSLIPIQM